MEGEICTYNKFGFCKFRKECKMIHFKEECKELEKCNNIKTCRKRHPRHCKKYASGQCMFKKDCAYTHQEPVKNLEQTEMVAKVKQLETVVQALTRKVLSLEEEMTELRIKNKTIKVCEVNDIEQQNISFNNSIKHTSSPVVKVKDSNSQAQERKDNSKESEVAGKFSCTMCKYKTKKEDTLKKHMITKHEEHVCKDCNEKLSTFMALLKHIAEYHSQEPSEDIDGKVGITQEHEDKKDLTEEDTMLVSDKCFS